MLQKIPILIYSLKENIFILILLLKKEKKWTNVARKPRPIGWHPFPVRDLCHPLCQVYVKHVQTQSRIWTKSNSFFNLYTLGTCIHNWNLAFQDKSSNVSNFTLRWHILYMLKHWNKNGLFISGWQSWHGFCDYE